MTKRNRTAAADTIALRCAVFLNLAARVGLTGPPDLDVLIKDQADSAGIAAGDYSPVTVKRLLNRALRRKGAIR